MRTCVDCGERFDGEDWKRRCLACWKAWKEGQVYEEGYAAGYAAGREIYGPALSPDLIRGAIALCHPDRHPPERAELANATTAQLIELRQAVPV